MAGSLDAVALEVIWSRILSVADEQQDALEKAAQPQVYSPIRQQMQNPMTFVVRSALDPASAIAAARREVQGVDRDLALTSVTTLEQLVSDAIGDHRFRTTLLSSFAAVALFLAALGIYGVLAYTVAQRTRELGIRLALGAQIRSVRALVMREAAVLALAGVIIGLGFGLAATRALATLLYAVSARDPLTFGLVSAALLAIATTATWLPARAATRIDPMEAMRGDL